MRRPERSWVVVARGGGLDHFGFAPGHGVGGGDRCFAVEDLNVRLMIQIQERVLCGKKAVSMRQYGLSGTGGSPLHPYLHVLAPSLRVAHHLLGQNPPKAKLERTHSSIRTLLGCGRAWTVQGMEETQGRSRQCR
jgi:hypothetical protein